MPSNKRRSAEDRPRLQRWVKFVGSSADQWKKILSQISIEKVPLEYVNDIRFHSKGGRIHLYEVKNLDESYIESLIEKTCDELGDISAIEYVIDLDQLNLDIATQVKALLKGSRDD